MVSWSLVFFSMDFFYSFSVFMFNTRSNIGAKWPFKIGLLKFFYRWTYFFKFRDHFLFLIFLIVFPFLSITWVFNFSQLFLIIYYQTFLQIRLSYYVFKHVFILVYLFALIFLLLRSWLITIFFDKMVDFLLSSLVDLRFTRHFS